MQPIRNRSMEQPKYEYRVMNSKSQNVGWSEDHIPYICWDRKWTVGDIRRRLQAEDSNERFRIMAWLMRELKPSEVWFFLSPAQVYKDLPAIEPFLATSKSFWQYLLGTWHELGKF